MIDKSFLQYMDGALKEYKAYMKKEKKQLTFQEFLLLVITWKTEEILEKIENR